MWQFLARAQLARFQGGEAQPYSPSDPLKMTFQQFHPPQRADLSITPSFFYSSPNLRQRTHFHKDSSCKCPLIQQPDSLIRRQRRNGLSTFKVKTSRLLSSTYCLHCLSILSHFSPVRIVHCVCRTHWAIYGQEKCKVIYWWVIDFRKK